MVYYAGKRNAVTAAKCRVHWSGITHFFNGTFH